MADSARYFFAASRDAHAQITHLFDFIEPTAIAMWNFRWQVQGYLLISPGATSADLSSRFALGSELRGGAIRRAAVDTSWEEQRSNFAAIVLTLAIAAFEDFTAQMARLAGNDGVNKNLQYPSGTYRGKATGRTVAYAALGPTSNRFRGVLTWDPAVKRRYAGNSIENLLTCYRYFKEARNSIAHNGGKATQAAVDAYAAFKTIATPHDLGLKEVPRHNALNALGDQVKMDLRGAIGLTNVILRIVTTYDVDFSGLAVAELEFKRHVKSLGQTDWLVSSDPTKRISQLASRLKLKVMPNFVLDEQMIKYLKNDGLIPSHA